VNQSTTEAKLAAVVADLDRRYPGRICTTQDWMFNFFSNLDLRSVAHLFKNYGILTVKELLRGKI